MLGPDKSVCHALLRPLTTRPFLRQDGRRWDGRSPQDPRKLCESCRRGEGGVVILFIYLFICVNPVGGGEGEGGGVFYFYLYY